MPRVLLLATDLERGGLPLRLTRLAVRLPPLGIEPIVGCLAGEGPLHSTLRDAGIATFACGARSSRDLIAVVRLARLIRGFRPDLIHASLLHANVAARLVGRLDRPRPILTATVTIEIERAWHRWLECLTGSLSDVHLANSAAVAEHIQGDLGFPPEKVVMVPNGVDLAAIAAASPVNRQAGGLRDDLPLVIWAGRMDPVKDLFTWVEAVAFLRRRLPVQAVLLGDGPERPAVQRRIADLGLRDVIIVARWSDEVWSWLKAADALLFTSRTEGSPNVVIEAMLCHCPIVAADVPALRELIEPGRHGLLCPVGDTAAFAAGLERILTQRVLAKEMAARAAERAAARHNLDHAAALLADLYHDLIRRYRSL